MGHTASAGFSWEPQPQVEAAVWRDHVESERGLSCPSPSQASDISMRAEYDPGPELPDGNRTTGSKWEPPAEPSQL